MLVRINFKPYLLSPTNLKERDFAIQGGITLRNNFLENPRTMLNHINQIQKILQIYLHIEL